MADEEPVPSLYRRERAKYKALFPKVKTHHMHPHEREGDDTEFNLFPWNLKAHDAWHRVFHNLTTREVWGILRVARAAVWDSGKEPVKPLWRWDYRTVFTLESERREYSHVRTIPFWRERWTTAFGGSTLEQAEYTLRRMMLAMAFGHRAFTDDVWDPVKLRALVAAIPPGSDRAWAFETCFSKPLNTGSYGALRRQVRAILHRSSAARP